MSAANETTLTTLTVPERVREAFNGEVRDVFQGALERFDDSAVVLARSGEVPDAESLDWELDRARQMREVAEQVPAEEFRGHPDALGDVVCSVMRAAAEELSGLCESSQTDLAEVGDRAATIAWCIESMRALEAEGARFADVPVLRVAETRAA